jgi:hypothetical protein
VRAHFDGQSLSAQIHTPGGSMGIQPVSDVMPGADPSVHAIYDVRDVLPVSGLCAHPRGDHLLPDRPRDRLRLRVLPGQPLQRRCDGG